MLCKNCYLGNTDVLAVAERRDWQIELSFFVALPEEFFASSVRPQPGDAPRATGVRDVGALQRDLERGRRRRERLVDAGEIVYSI